MENKQKQLILETMEIVLELELRSIRQALGKDEPQVGV